MRRIIESSSKQEDTHQLMVRGIDDEENERREGEERKYVEQERG